ncbi:hypothetical protein TIFTF001_016892 [Ficus carica]|uniref:Uncharacterized protein n=1 Tax=Ficus carica TaxID=3494 RepID=A0AA88D961_FICCA|nr:hypothetical protein TIFTF001_016892 [Ficus carica]
MDETLVAPMDKAWEKNKCLRMVRRTPDVIDETLRSLSLLLWSDQIIMNEVDKLGDGFGKRHMNHGGGDQKRLFVYFGSECGDSGETTCFMGVKALHHLSYLPLMTLIITPLARSPMTMTKSDSRGKCETLEASVETP